jgi:hypothetical protein
MIECKISGYVPNLHSVSIPSGYFLGKGVAVERARVHEILTNTAYCSHNGSHTMSPGPRLDVEHPRKVCAVKLMRHDPIPGCIRAA